MRTQTQVTDWILTVVPHRDVRATGFCPKTPEEVQNSPYGCIPAAVPGNFELDLQRAGLLPDLYYADNILEAQKLENRHLWYAAEFETAPDAACDAFLTFHGIDTAAEIFLDGEQIGFSENMFVPFVYKLSDTKKTRHTVAVHIIPAMIHARETQLSLASFAHDFNDDSVKLRKAPYMFGWDIMPRLVSAGLWKPVTVEYKPKNRIDEVYIFPRSLRTDGGDADMRVKLSVSVTEDYISDYAYRIEGTCGGRSFVFERPLMSVDAVDGFCIPDPCLWYPKNYGAQNLYDVTVTLLCKNAPCDSVGFRLGLRIVELERTSLAGDDGEFVIRVNGQKIFCMGSNLVPTDAYPSRMADYTRRQCDLLEDLGCNIVRCWGGNVYPDDDFFDFCDAHGILVWQDFAMACGRYPEDAHTRALLETEVTHVVRRLRQHPSLAIWAGDNECDGHEPRQYLNGRMVNGVDPNSNILTRGLIPFVLRNEDFTRPYVPSSPYVDPVAYRRGEDRVSAEQHLWGPRDFFKGDFYVNSTAHFASETGYHGCPSPASLKKFISPAALGKMGDGKKSDNPEWMLHSSTFRTDDKAPFNYRISLMIRQVERLFGSADKDLEIFALQSQISQAEAKKFFIEHFRCAKWRRTGIIWWNLIDGWPQVSDAVVDWYGAKKLAYSYIKRAQQPFCLLFDEPVCSKLTLKAANDTQETVTVSYKVTDLTAGAVVLEGTCAVAANETGSVAEIVEDPNAFYLMEWTGDREGKNHYAADIYHGLDFGRYVENIKKAGFYAALEGFDTI